MRRTVSTLALLLATAAVGTAVAATPAAASTGTNGPIRCCVQ